MLPKSYITKTHLDELIYLHVRYELIDEIWRSFYKSCVTFFSNKKRPFATSFKHKNKKKQDDFDKKFPQYKNRWLLIFLKD